MTEKTDEQIARDKEAVKAMTGAKNAMEAALRRIEVLEVALKSVRHQTQAIAKPFGQGLYLNVLDAGGSSYRPVALSELFGRIDETIKRVM